MDVAVPVGTARRIGVPYRGRMVRRLHVHAGEKVVDVADGGPEHGDFIA